MSKYKEAAQLRGETRSADVVDKVRKAMQTILAEMKANNGIYPANGGAVSKNEVARRAGISLTTLFSPKQRQLGEEVTLWLDTLKKKETIGRQRVRRTFAQRAEDWKTRYETIATHLALAKLETQQAEAERDEALAEVRKLSDQNAALLEQLRLASASKVKPFPKGKR